MAEKEYVSDSPPLKAGSIHTESVEGQNKTYDPESPKDILHTVDAGFTDVVTDEDPEAVARALRKVDYRLVPVLSLLYLVAYVDRSNSTRIQANCTPVKLTLAQSGMPKSPG